MDSFLGGAPVECADGPCGVLGWIAVDPASLSVTHLAIDDRITRSFGKLVPIGIATPSADRIRLDCTNAEFESFPDADERHFVPTEEAAELLTIDQVPVGEVKVGGEEEIRTSDGPGGRLLGLTVGAGGAITALVIEVGHLNRKHRVSVPVDLVRSIDQAGIDLTISRARLVEL
jgi:hypothetical protein